MTAARCGRGSDPAPSRSARHPLLEPRLRLVVGADQVAAAEHAEQLLPLFIKFSAVYYRSMGIAGHSNSP